MRTTHAVRYLRVACGEVLQQASKAHVPTRWRDLPTNGAVRQRAARRSGVGDTRGGGALLSVLGRRWRGDTLEPKLQYKGYRIKDTV